MVEGIGNRAAARLVGCTHGAIGKAIERGHLLTLPNGKIDPIELEKWNECRRPERGYRDEVSRPVSILTAAHFEIPSHVAAITSMAEGFASDVVLALLPHLPEATIKMIYDCLLSEWRNVGADLADDEFEPPVGLTSWSEHTVFKKPVSLDWQELRDLAGQP